MLPDDWRHVSLAGQELVKDMLKLDATGTFSAYDAVAFVVAGGVRDE